MRTSLLTLMALMMSVQTWASEIGWVVVLANDVSAAEVGYRPPKVQRPAPQMTLEGLKEDLAQFEKLMVSIHAQTAVAAAAAKQEVAQAKPASSPQFMPKPPIDKEWVRAHFGIVLAEATKLDPELQDKDTEGKAIKAASVGKSVYLLLEKSEGHVAVALAS